ncbi:hypothetical protein ETB97_006179 [Aspergillus alliaceus]|uniref:Uncharacterized protein n=1 Tax=Petromyces alliaceus TaxID=209559 RepID=A0A8H5ZXR5_PETAA|nr:hypothetical protein ETB97_006179 [Aspergillus burnettii]
MLKTIHNKMAQNGVGIGNWKRDEIIPGAETQMCELFQLPVTLDGFVPHHHPKIARIKLAEAFEEDHAVMSLGLGYKSNNGTLGNRESYEDEYSTNGGIDFTDCFTDTQSTYLLNTGSEHQQMDRDIQCYFLDLEILGGWRSRSTTLRRGRLSVKAQVIGALAPIVLIIPSSSVAHEPKNRVLPSLPSPSQSNYKPLLQYVFQFQSELGGSQRPTKSWALAG